MEVKKLESHIRPLAMAAMIVAMAGAGLVLLQDIFTAVILSNPWKFYSLSAFSSVLGFFGNVAMWGGLAVFAFGMANSAMKNYVDAGILKALFILACCVGGLYMMGSVMPAGAASLVFTILGSIAMVGYVVLQVLVYVKICKLPDFKSFALWTMILFIVLGTNVILGWVPFLNILIGIAIAAATVFYVMECNKIFGK